MKVHLLDVNVLLALSWRTHVHHEAARHWFDRNAASGWATCPLTQCGFVRLSCNRGVFDDAVTAPIALDLLRELTADKQHEFWADDLPLDTPHFPRDLLQGHRQVSDAYLLALCRSRNGVLATFDRAVSALQEAALDESSVVLIPAG
jgi:toxin-antitoxin system PIN domain toxin